MAPRNQRYYRAHQGFAQQFWRQQQTDQNLAEVHETGALHEEKALGFHSLVGPLFCNKYPGGAVGGEANFDLNLRYSPPPTNKPPSLPAASAWAHSGQLQIREMQTPERPRDDQPVMIASDARLKGPAIPADARLKGPAMPADAQLKGQAIPADARLMGPAMPAREQSSYNSQGYYSSFFPTGEARGERRVINEGPSNGVLTRPWQMNGPIPILLFRRQRSLWYHQDSAELRTLIRWLPYHFNLQDQSKDPFNVVCPQPRMAAGNTHPYFPETDPNPPPPWRPN